MFLFPLGGRINSGQAIMTTYTIIGLALLTALGILFLVSFLRKNYKSVEILAWLLVIGNSFAVFGFLSYVISALFQSI